MNDLNLRLFQDKVLTLQSQVRAKQQNLKKILEENEIINAEVAAGK
jgi:regulator of replication initiation timing